MTTQSQMSWNFVCFTYGEQDQIEGAVYSVDLPPDELNSSGMPYTVSFRETISISKLSADDRSAITGPDGGAWIKNHLGPARVSEIESQMLSQLHGDTN